MKRKPNKLRQATMMISSACMILASFGVTNIQAKDSVSPITDLRFASEFTHKKAKTKTQNETKLDETSGELKSETTYSSDNTNAGAFERSLIRMQYSYSDKLRKKDSTATRIDGGVSNPGYFTVISNKPLEVQQASIPQTNEETVNQYKHVEMSSKESDEIESNSEQNETESQQ